MNPTGARRPGRVKIKPPKRHGTDFDLEKTWSDLSKNIIQIFRKNASTLSFEENHRYAYNMVLHKHGDRLYNGVSKLIATHLESLATEEIIPAFPPVEAGGSSTMMMPTTTTTTTTHDSSADYTHARDVLLKCVTTIWQDYMSNILNLSQVLKYMDRVYVKSVDLPETWTLGRTLFLKHIIRPPIQEQITLAILRQIQHDRDGYAISPATIKGCVAIFLSLEHGNAGVAIYKTDLEPAIIEDSYAYYKAEGMRLLESCDAPDFLRRVESRFDSEYNRVHLYLSPQTWLEMESILKTYLLRSHISEVITMPNSGLETMIELDKLDDLSRLYKLCIKVPPVGIDSLKRGLKASVIQRGQTMNQMTSSDGSIQITAGDDDAGGGASKGKNKGSSKGSNSAAQTLTIALRWVEDVLSLKDKFDKIWNQAFQADREIESTLNGAFETFIDVNKKSPEYISLFIDEHLKRGLKGKSDSDVDTILDKTITVFRYVSEKDLFEEFYKSHLAKRLLLGRSVSDDAERGMLAKLKVECGFQFTQKMEGMFNDMKISAEHNKAYKTYLRNIEGSPSIDLNVTVMTSSFWPMQHSKSTCMVPKCLQRPMASFEQFYHSKHSGRKLTWQFSLGNADVRAQFAEGAHDLNVSTFGLVILLLFDTLGEDEYLEYEEIKNATEMEERELNRHLQSLACAKYKVLLKHPPGKDVNPSDSFSFNIKFKCPLQRIKISTISATASAADTGGDRKKTLDNVETQRKFQIEACIVRVMKDRKHMTHNNLLNEVAKQLGPRFKPDAAVIKKRIEDLIDREYLERCEDKKSYNYLA